MMTENQWTGASTPEPFGQFDNGSPAANAWASGTAESKKDVAKEEASQVAGHVAWAAQGVTQTARKEAANVASEAKTGMQDLLAQAKSDLSGQAGTQQQKVAEGIRTISSQLQTMADAPEQQGMASDLIRQAAQRSESAASWLENKEPGDLLVEAQRFARNRPGTFLLLAAGAGVLAGRLTRGLNAGGTGAQPSSRVTAAGRHPAAVQQETVFAAGTGAELYDEPVVGAGAPVSTTSLPSGTAEDTPLRLEDPYPSTEGRQL